MMIQITKDNFEAEVAQARDGLLLLFWSEHHSLSSTSLEKLEDLTAGTALQFCTLHTNQQRDLAIQFELMGLPAAYLIRIGRIIYEWYAPQPESRLLETVEQLGV